MLFYMMVVLYGLWIMEALRRNGLNPGSLLSTLNPFAAIHRARWRKKLTINPLYTLNDPRDAMSILLLSLIKSTGEITGEQKRLVLRSLRTQFGFTEEEASHHFALASFLMRDTVDILADLPKIMTPLIGTCNAAQLAEVKQMLTNVSTIEGTETPNRYQTAFIARVMQLLEEKK